MKYEELVNRSKTKYITSLRNEWVQSRLKNLFTADIEKISYDLDELELLVMTLEGEANKCKITNKPNSREIYDTIYRLWEIIFENKNFKDLEEYLRVLYHVTINGVFADQLADIRMKLNDLKIKLSECFEQAMRKEDWYILVKDCVIIATCLLVRKADGWSDLEFTEEVFRALRVKQKEVEETYLKSALNNGDSLIQAQKVLALYNMLQGLSDVKEFLQKGDREPETKIERYCYNALDIFQRFNFIEEIYFVKLFEKIMKRLVNNSIWKQVSGYGDRIKQFVVKNSNHFLELWPSQKDAIDQSLFDISKNSIVIQMPTSAGKTLLSIFHILLTFQHYQNAKIAYIAPTRALVNQIKRSLKAEIGDIEMGEHRRIRVAAAVSAPEIDSMEEAYLANDIDILVTTPEKLDLLIKMKHPIVNSLKLFIVDEAHNIENETRGAKLELLLATIKEEYNDAKIMLLSPFIPNAKEISQWLGDERSLDICINWRPTQQFIGYYHVSGKRSNRVGKVTYLPSFANIEYTEPFEMIVNPTFKGDKSNKQNLLQRISSEYKKLGGTLIIRTNKTWVEKLARNLANENERINGSKIADLLNLVGVELGKDSTLYHCLEHGIAYHHSGLPEIVRNEIEKVMKDGLIQCIVATTTLAQGMNFPISTVIFGDYKYPFGNEMTRAEFWNIAGRAGRSLLDREGHVIFLPSPNNWARDLQKLNEYITEKANDLRSSLYQVFEDIETVNEQLDLNLIRSYPALSAFYQYLLHLKIISQDQFNAEDILRSSLLYRQLNNDPDKDKLVIDKIVKMTANYLNELTGNRNQKYLNVIDTSGLSKISMDYIFSEVDRVGNIKYQKVFNLFDPTLQKAIEILNKVPEMDLTLKIGDQFSPAFIAMIAKEWVRGSTLKEIATEVNFQENLSISEKLLKCGNYIYSKLINMLPWGISALQKMLKLKGQQVDDGDLYIPSCIYYGVQSKEAVALSYLGVPRIAAEGLAGLWRDQHGQFKDGQFMEMNNWIEQITIEEWKQAVKDKDINLPVSLIKKYWEENKY